jgi:signal transduction histidine kinase
MMNESVFSAQSFPEMMLDHRGTVSLVSGMMSLIFAMVIFSLVRREGVLKDEKWVKPFAYTFLILAINSFIRSVARMQETDWFAPFPYDKKFFAGLEVLRTLCSGLTNFLFFYVGLWLRDIEGADRNRLLNRIRILRNVESKESVAKFLTLGVFLLAAVIPDLTGRWWASLPDTFISAAVLFFVGYTLYHNIGIRRDKLMALIALYASACYSVIELYRGLIRLLVANEVGSYPALTLIFVLLAMALKCGIFFPGYGLMLLISTSTAGVRTLFKSITHGESEYLESNGVVKAIWLALGASRVELYITLPGTKCHEIACYGYPPRKGKQGNESIRPKIETFDPARTYGHVIATGRKLTYRLTNRPDVAPAELMDRFSALSSILAVPIFFHKAVIGCLKVVIDDGRVNEADFQNIDRFATLISPTVQAYRQVEALNQLSQRVARYQIEQSVYNLEHDIRGIIQIVHDVLAPVATGVVINSGFKTYVLELIEPEYDEAIRNRISVVASEETVIVGGEEIKYLPRGLEITFKKFEESSREDEPQPRGDDATSVHSFGTLILVTKDAGPRTEPTLATGFFYRQAVSNVITDSLLDFMRGYLSQVTNRLSVKLSSINQINLSEWIRHINASAKEADLRWAAASQPDSEELLDPEGQSQLIQSLDGKWAVKDEGLWLCPVASPRDNTTHVIKVKLSDTEQTLWLGVDQADFGMELEYVSPWYAFIRILSGVADSSMRRMTSEQQRERIEKEVSEFHGLATVAITTGTVIHEIANQVQEILWPVTMLEDAVRRKTLLGNEAHKEAIFSLRNSATHIEELTRLFAGVIKPDSRRPCSLIEAIRYAESLVHESISRLHIKFYVQVSPFHFVDVPFYVSAFTLINLLSNAKNALKKAPDSGREIRISAEDTGDGIRCQISDNGPGIPPHLISQIFEPGSKDNGAGSGLGLYLSARSMSENRGHLELTHPGPTPNTTFTLFFPKPRRE